MNEREVSACQNAALSCAGTGPSLCFSSDAHVNSKYFYTILKATAADIAFLMPTTTLFIYLLLPSSLQHVRKRGGRSHTSALQGESYPEDVLVV